MCCEYCMDCNCSSVCPNKDEPLYEYTCVNCKEPVYQGKEYLDTLKGYICKECISDMSSLEVLNYLDVRFDLCKVG